MALVGNGVRLAAGPIRHLGVAAVIADNRENWGQAGPVRNFWAGEATADAAFSSIPAGKAAPNVWALAPRTGGLSSFRSSDGYGAVTSAAMANGRSISADLSGTGTISTAAMALLVPLAASIAAGGAVLAAGLEVIINAISATLSGGGTITGANLELKLGLTADLSGQGTLQAAMVGKSHASAQLSGQGSVAGNLTAKAHMAAEITPFAELSPQSLATAVWDAVAAANNDTGTMGEKMNAAGSAGDPWTGNIEGSLNAKQVLRVLLAVATGAMEVVDNGGGSYTMRFKSVDGLTDRVVADIVDEERTDVVLTP